MSRAAWLLSCASALQLHYSSGQEAARAPASSSPPVDAAIDARAPVVTVAVDAVPPDAAFTADMFLGKSFIPRTRAALANGFPDYTRAMQIADLFEEYCIDARAIPKRHARFKRHEILDGEYDLVMQIFADVFICECGHPTRCP